MEKKGIIFKSFWPFLPFLDTETDKMGQSLVQETEMKYPIFRVKSGDKTIRTDSNHKGSVIYFTFKEKLVHGCRFPQSKNFIPTWGEDGVKNIP